MNNETYIIFGMIFGFLALWLFFSLAKKLRDSSRFPKQKKNQKTDQKIFLPTPWWRPFKTKILTPLLKCYCNDKASLTKYLKLNEITLETKYFKCYHF